MTATYAGSVVSAPSRSRRDTLLLAGGATLTGAGVLAFIGAILSLIGELQSVDSAGLKVASGFDLLAACVGVAAFAVLIPAFLARSSSRRATLLGTSLALVGGSAVATLTSDLLQAVEFGVNHAAGTYVAQAAVAAVADLVLVGAATIGAVAFFSSSSTGVDVRRDGMLGWAASVFGTSLVFSMVSALLLLVFFSDNFAPGGITSGLGVAVAGYAVEVAAAIVVAVAFFGSQRKRERAQAWLAQRDGLLAVAASVLVLSLLLVGIGKMVFASGLSSFGFDGKTVAGAWLNGTASLVELAAMACASVGLFLSRRTPTNATSVSLPAPSVSAARAPGQELASFCSNCGNVRSPGTRFCQSCGHAF